MCVASLLFFQLFPCLSGGWLLGLGAASSDAVETPLVCSLDGPTAGVPFAAPKVVSFIIIIIIIIQEKKQIHLISYHFIGYYYSDEKNGDIARRIN